MADDRLGNACARLRRPRAGAGQQADLADIFSRADTADAFGYVSRLPRELQNAGSDNVERSIRHPLRKKLLPGLQAARQEKVGEAVDLRPVEAVE